jgi:hypothetical protein
MQKNAVGAFANAREAISRAWPGAKLFLILCSENIDEDAGPLVAARFA